MAREFKDRVQDTTQTTGTGAFTLDAATIAGYRTFGSAHTVGATLDYFVSLGSDWEAGTGTLTSANVLARTTVNASSNAGALVSFGVGSKSIYETVGGQLMNQHDNSIRRALVPRKLLSSNVPASGAGSYIPASYPKTRAALAAVAAGTANMTYGLIGDSTTMGVGALNTSTANCRLAAPVESLTRALNSVNLPAKSLNFDGDSNFYVSSLGSSSGGAGNSGYQGFDTRLTLPTGWVETTTQSVGGAFFQNTTNVSALTFNSLGWDATDTVVVRYRTSSAATPFTIGRPAYGGAAAWTTQTITPALTEGLGVATVTGILTQGGIAITPTAVGTVEILGIEAYDSTLKSIHVHSLGWSGGDTAQMIATGNGAAWNPLPALLSFKFDLVSIQLGTNGWNNSIPVATWQANLDTLVAANLSNGSEVILVTPYPSSAAVAPYLTQMNYVNAIYAVALKYNLIVNDVFRKTGAQEQGYQYGFYFDNKHPRNPLYQTTMEGLADVIMSIA